MKLGKYIAWFAGATVVVTALYALIGSVMKSGSSTFSLLVPFFAAWMAVTKFVQDQHRTPDERERWRLIWSSFAVSVGIALIGVAVVTASGGLAAMADVLGVPLLVALIGVGLVVTFFGIWAGYHWMGNRALRTYERAQERRRQRDAR